MPGASLVAGSAALLVGTAAFYVAFGYFRGELRITTGNVLQVLGVGFLPPVLVLALPGASIATLVALMGLGSARDVVRLHRCRRSCGAWSPPGPRS